MAKYINLEELMKFPIRHDHYDKEHGSKDFIYGIETVLEYAENLPADDVAPVRYGRWLCGDYYDIGDVCSECDWDSQMTHPSYRYCPNCGAKMDEVSE